MQNREMGIFMVGSNATAIKFIGTVPYNVEGEANIAKIKEHMFHDPSSLFLTIETNRKKYINFLLIWSCN